MAVNSLSKNAKIIYLYEKQDKKCPYCGISFMENGELKMDINIDHIIPSSRGGKNVIENLCLSCFPCNSAKGDMTAEEFSDAISKLKEGKITKNDLRDYAKYFILKKKFGEI